MFHAPFLLLVLFIFFFVLGGLFAFIQVGVIGYAFQKIGIAPGHLFVLLMLSLFGSFVNLPLKRLPGEPIRSLEPVRLFGMTYNIPVARRREMVLAVNVGGALIPCLLSLYLWWSTGQTFKLMVATGLVALVTHQVARPIPGVGIAVPLFIPPLVAAAAAMLLSSTLAPPIAYVAGTMGTLIGADLLNLGRLRELRAPMVSIGGAGTFDGIFLTGIIAALLA